VKLTVKFVYFIITVFILCVSVLAEDLTIADVAAAQEDYQKNIHTFAASVTATTEYNGEKKDLSYDYVMQTDGAGNSKMMITGTGALKIQMLVDTKEGSVTYLMADGSTKKFTLPAEERDAIMQQYAGIGSFGGENLNSMFADANGGIKDMKTARNLRVKEAETADYKVKVGREFFGGRAIVEYKNKKMTMMADEFDRNIKIAEDTPAKNDKDKRIKKKYLNKLKSDRDNIKRHMIAKRVEKINMKTGITEEQEFYNDENEKLGYMRVKRKREIRNPQSAIRNLEVPVESEVEMESAQGKAKTDIKMDNVRINVDVKFEWLDTKQEGKK